MRTILPLLVASIVAGSCLAGAASRLPALKAQRWVNSAPLTHEGLRGKSVEIADDLTSQSRHSLPLSGSPPSGKLLIPLERRDVRVVKGARLEIDSGRACWRISKPTNAVRIKHLPQTTMRVGVFR